MKDIPEWQIACCLALIFGFGVAVFGYFWAKDKDALAGAWIMTLIVAVVALWKAGKAGTE